MPSLTCCISETNSTVSPTVSVPRDTPSVQITSPAARPEKMTQDWATLRAFIEALSR